MFKRLAVLMIVFAALIGAKALAQADDPLAAIPACTADEQQGIVNALVQSGVSDAIHDFGSQGTDIASMTPGQMATVLEAANTVQVTWHWHIRPDLPNCSLVYQIDRTLGQWGDESTIAFALLEAATSYSTRDPALYRRLAGMIEDHTAYMGSGLRDFQTLYQTMTEALPDVVATEAVSDAQPLSFSGSNDQVIGPVTIPAGTYRATATTAGFIIVHVDALSGECGEGTGRNLSISLFSASRGQAVNGAEAVLTSRGCSALLSVSNVQQPWTLEFEKIG